MGVGRKMTLWDLGNALSRLIRVVLSLVLPLGMYGLGIWATYRYPSDFNEVQTFLLITLFVTAVWYGINKIAVGAGLRNGGRFVRGRDTWLLEWEGFLESIHLRPFIAATSVVWLCSYIIAMTVYEQTGSAYVDASFRIAQELSPLWLFVPIVILVPLLQQILATGFLYPRLQFIMGRGLTVIVTTLVLTLTQPDLVAMVLVAPMIVIACSVRECTNHVTKVMPFPFLYALLTYLAMYFVPFAITKAVANPVTAVIAAIVLVLMMRLVYTGRSLSGKERLFGHYQRNMMNREMGRGKFSAASDRPRWWLQSSQ